MIIQISVDIYTHFFSFSYHIYVVSAVPVVESHYQMTSTILSQYIVIPKWLTQ